MVPRGLKYNVELCFFEKSRLGISWLVNIYIYIYIHTHIIIIIIIIITTTIIIMITIIRIITTCVCYHTCVYLSYVSYGLLGAP